MGGLYRGGLVGLHQQVKMNLWVSIFGALRIAGVIPALVGVSQTIQAFFIYQGRVALAEMFVLRVALRRCLPFSGHQDRFSWENFHQIKRFAGGMTLLTCLGTVVSQMDKFVLSKILPLPVFGEYLFSSAMACSLNVFVFGHGRGLFSSAQSNGRSGG
jgi:O-antigen/teichoic acid export membrane protein